MRRAAALLACLVSLAAIPRARAQDDTAGHTSRFEQWYELDLWKRLGAADRLLVPIRFRVAGVDGYLNGMIGALWDRKLGGALAVRGGYRYSRTVTGGAGSDPSNEHRVLGELTPHLRPGLGLVLLDRSRVELRWIDGDCSWRYRNRIRAERTFVREGAHALTPYAMLEVGYDSRYDTINRARVNLGGTYAFTHDLSLDLHALHQRDTRSSVSRMWALGATLSVTY